MLKLKRISFLGFPTDRLILSSISYSTLAADEANVSNEESSVRFGFTADDLLKAKPYEDIPSPRAYPLVGNLFTFKPFGDLDLFDRISTGRKLQERYGDIVKFSFPIISDLKNIVKIFDPDDFEIVYRNEGRYPSRPVNPVMLSYRKERNQSLGLFLANGEEWWKFRQPLNPGMMKVNAAKPYLSVQDSIDDDLVQTIKERLKLTNNNFHLKIMDDIFRYSLEAVCAIVFDKRLGCMDADLQPDSWQQEFIDSVHTAFQALFTLNLNPLYKIYNTVGYKGKKQLAFEKSMDYISKKSLELLKQSKDQWTDIPETELETKFLAQLLNIKNISIDDKVSVIFDMMFAAIDTTTYTAMSNFFYLAKNPTVQDKLLKEINEHIPKDGALNTALLEKMHYFRACVKESNRLKPIATVIKRQLTQDIVVKGYFIPKGTMVLIEHHYVSNNEKYVENPEMFNPDRWIRSIRDQGKLHPFLVLPFGFGPRMCIGKRFAEQEINIALIKLVQNFRIEFDGEKLPLKGIGLDKLPVNLKFRLIERYV